jgi:hypothetical protein
MHLINTLEIQNALERLDRIGCVIEFLVFSLDEEDGTDGAVHREAALSTLRTMKMQNDDYFDKLLESAEYAGRRRDEFFQFDIRENAIGDGERLSVDAFLGPYCDLQRRRLLFQGAISKHRNGWFWFGDEETKKEQMLSVSYQSPDAGLSGAYVAPPYNLGGSRSEQNAAFFDLLDMLLGGMRGEYVIYHWSDDASNFFDAGKEWWGTYFWTAHEIGTDRIIGIAASATD